jgi:YcaO cyclodehydratase, ATP-ad Mg2+-binding
MSLPQLRERYPLPEQWEEPTLFLETTTVGVIDIHVAGICARNRAGDIATGSAGDLLESPLNRAYFELLERASIITMWSTMGTILPTRSAIGAPTAHVPRDVIAPTSCDHDRWAHARSNGVAAGRTWQEACNRAEWELVERDRVLRSWYGELGCSPLEIPRAMVPPALYSLYWFEAYVFGESEASNVQVAGVFGFPKHDDAPMLYGFGARPQLDQALTVAASECIQRLGFLWGEEIPSVQPVFSATPDFHQEFFLWPGAHERLHRWLAGEHRQLAQAIVGSVPVVRCDRRFLDMTPAELTTKLFVAKAIPAGEMLLVFGDGHPDLHGLPDDLRIHPIS